MVSEQRLQTSGLTQKQTHEDPEDEDQEKESYEGPRAAGTMGGSRCFGPLASSSSFIHPHLNVGSVALLFLLSEYLNLKMSPDGDIKC